MDNCTIDCIEMIGNFSKEATCNFVTQSCVQDTVQIIQGYYCLVNGSMIILGIFSILILLLVYYAINIATDQFLAPTLQDFIVKLNMSEALAGITFLALANGAPDIITAVVAGTSSSDSTVLIPFGSLYGAALFSMGFILSMVIYYSKGRKLKLNIRETVVPLGFYVCGTLYLAVVSIFYKKMDIIIAVIFFSFYLVYIAFVVYEERTKSKNRRPKDPLSLLSDKEQDEEDLAPKDSVRKSFEEKVDEVYEEIHQKEEKQDKKNQKKKIWGSLTHYIRVLWIMVFNYTIPVILKDEVKIKQLISGLVLSPLVIFLAKGIPDVFEDTLLGVAQAVWMTVPSILLLIYTIYNLVRGQKPYFTTIFNIYSFFVVVTWIALVVSVLINLMELLQLLTNINSVFLGLTVFAGASSIGDYLSIVTFAKRGYSSTAVSGIFSGQLLNFLIGFGVACIVKSLDEGQYEFNLFKIEGSSYDIISDFIVMVVIGMALFYMIGLIIVVLIKKGQLGNSQRIITRILYIGFILVALIISIMTDFFREIECDL